MRRRDFVNLLGSVAAAWPLTVRAQQLYRMRRVGVLLGNAEVREAHPFIAALRDELVKLGWTEGRNVQINIRSAPADVASMRRFAKELAALQPDLIVTESTPAAGAMLEETRTIPVVFTLVADPVGSGFAASLSRPGGNATGFTPIVSSLGGKWVELLKEIAPHIARVTLLFNPPTATFVQDYLTSFRAAAASVGVDAIVAPINEMSELQSRFATQTSQPKNGLVVMPDAFTQHYLAEIAELAARYRVPAVNWSRSFTEVGGLISYGPYLVEEFRRAASYVDRILKGERPSDLPVQAPVKFELVVNLKTAKALGLTVPPSLLARADEVIE
jgi:putative ABC transport system substrate-binding protein